MTVSPFPCGKGVFFYENNLCRPPAHNPPRRAHTFVEMEKKAISGNLQEDCAQLKALLTQILSTNEGKALAEKLSRFENGK